MTIQLGMRTRINVCIPFLFLGGRNMTKNKQSIKGKIFELLQKLGPALTMGIAVVPIGGILLAIGTMLTTPTFVNFLPFLNTYPVITIANLLVTIGNMILGNLHIIFCVSVALGYCEKDGVAGFSAILSFLTFHTSINYILNITSDMASTQWELYATYLGIPSLNIGVFGGLLCGGLTAFAYHKFKETKLPTALSFFEGKRFVPIMAILLSIVMAILMSFIWPSVQMFISSLGNGNSENMFAIMLCIFLCCALIPFGLHTLFYAIYAFQMGTYVSLSGEVFHGLASIYFAQLADGVPLTTFYGISYSYINGALLIGVACAILKEAKPQYYEKTKSIMSSAILVNLLTGISEPIVFSFALQCYPLYLLLSIFVALGAPLMKFLSIQVGTGFCGGLMDYFIYGVLQNAHNWWLGIIICPIIAFLFYKLCRYLIRKFDLKTLGRYDDGTSLETNEVLFHDEDSLAIKVLNALGGQKNVSSIDACATRIRVTVFSTENIDKNRFMQLGANGVMEFDKNYQIVFGAEAIHIVDQIKAVMNGQKVESTSQLIKETAEMKNENILSPLTGKLLTLKEVPDNIFAEKMMGPGFAIDPSDGEVYSPVNGKVESVFTTKHCISIVSKEGKEVMIHLGIDTVKLEGKPFNILVKAGDTVKAGDHLGTIDLNYISRLDYSAIVPIVFTNILDHDVQLKKTGHVQAKEDNIIEFIKK